MFSGLITHQGRIASISGDVARGITLVVEAPAAIAEGVAEKDSVAINGACLTVTAVDATTMRFDVVPETVVRTNLGALANGHTVNVELSLRLGDRLGGHLVYAHVDCTAAIVSKLVEGQGHRLIVETPPSIAAYVVEKGYITVDGVSLTVASVAAGRFAIALIPETAKRTTLGPKGPGDRVNLEVDPVARYAAAAVAAYANQSDARSSDELEWAYEI